ncbi:MAG: hypothetical protein KAQ65_07180, partial [Candidatus Thorarchaeota archaeon]|nr:hypothetical protein [Candidatus Thorarchaeota archaeon]
MTEGKIMKHSKLTLLVGLVLVFSLFLSAPVGHEIESEINGESVRTKVFEMSYDEHAVIDIDNDTHFADQATSEGWDGNGDVNDPYIIENYNITANGICIDIQ